MRPFDGEVSDSALFGLLRSDWRVPRADPTSRPK